MAGHFARARRTQAAVVPHDADFGKPFACGIVVRYDGGQRERFAEAFRGGCGHAGRIAEFQRAVRGVQIVAPHVAERACPEVPPAAEIERVVDRATAPVLGCHVRDRIALWPHALIGAHRGRSDPQLPVERVRHGVIARRASWHPLGPDGTVGPDVDFAHGTDGSCGNELAGTAPLFSGVGASGDLCGCAREFGGSGYCAALFDRVGERFDAADVFLCPQGCQRDDGVGVIGRAAVHGIDFVALGCEQVSEIAVAASLREEVVCLFCVDVVHVAEGFDLKAGLGALLQLRMTDAADADSCERDLFAGRRMALASQYMTGHNCESED